MAEDIEYRVRLDTAGVTSAADKAADEVERLDLVFEGLPVTLSKADTYLVAASRSFQKLGQSVEVAGESFGVLAPAVERSRATLVGLNQAEDNLARSVDGTRVALLAQEQAIAAVGKVSTAAGAAVKGISGGNKDAKDTTGLLNQSLLTLTYTTNDATQFFRAGTAGGIDFAQGMRAIGNNIPGLISSLTNLGQAGFGGIVSLLAGPGGLILGLTAVAALVPLLSQHWGELESALGVGLPAPALEGPELLAKNLKKATDELERLQEKSRVNIAEIGRIGELTAEVKKLKKETEDIRTLEGIVGAPSKAEREVGAGFKEAVAESGGKDALAELTDKLGKKEAEELFRAAAGGEVGARERIKQTLGPDSQFSKNIDIFSPESKERDAEARKREDELIELQEKEKKRQLDAEKKIADERQKLAERLAKGELVTSLLRGDTQGVSEIQDIVKRTTGKDISEREAVNVRDAIEVEIGKKTGELSETLGISPEQVRNKLLKEREDQFLASTTAGVDEQKSDFQRKLKEAESQDPGFQAKLAAFASSTFAQGGQDFSQVAIRNALAERGLTGFGAEFFAKDAAASEQRKAVERALAEKPRSVELFGGENLINKIQQGVGGEQDTPQKQLRIAERQLEVLQKLERQRQGPFGQQGAVFQ